MIWLTWAFTGIAVVFAVHTVINVASAAWYTNGIQYCRTYGHAEYQQRKANAPWYVRYFEWLERRIFNRKANR